MDAPALFIGVVSYAGSRFAVSQGSEGLAAHLERALGPDFPVAVEICIEDLHDERALPIDDHVIQQSLSAQEALENAWIDYLHAGRPRTWSDPRRWSDQGRASLRWGRRQWRRIHRPGPDAVTRLVNIELAHLQLLRHGLATGSPWILVLEDDAYAPDLVDCATGLAGLIRDAPDSVAYINVSESFPLAQLGIEQLLTPAAIDWAGSRKRALLSASRPVTNTVCAILYRSSFAQHLLDEYAQMPMTPVVPIDWKLNQALMRMHADGRLGDGTCWLVSPAPIDQLSMRPAP